MASKRILRIDRGVYKELERYARLCDCEDDVDYVAEHIIREWVAEPLAEEDAAARGEERVPDYTVRPD